MVEGPEQFSIEQIARRTLRSCGAINNVARDLRVGKFERVKLPTGRTTRRYLFTSEERRQILEALRFQNDVLSAERSDFGVFVCYKGERDAMEFVTLERAGELTGNPIGTWWKRIDEGRCQGVYFGRHYVSLSDVKRYLNAPKGKTMAGVARQLGISKRTVYNYRGKGVFEPKRNLSGKTVLSEEQVGVIRATYESHRKSENADDKKRADVFG